ncbi:MAG TPA: SCO family protein [Chromatiaceae bacterium]|nr:SCO family protein [Chromatiaceae bacterium]HIP70329.1 SCO family protein [Anaerolineae bacterium]
MDNVSTTTPEADQEPKTRSRNKTIIIALISLVVGIGLGYFLLKMIIPYQYHGSTISSSQPMTNFTLTGPGGEPVSLIDYRDKVVLIYFGYTFCPDVCPATMVELKAAMAELGNKADDVQVIMITLDPERDTWEVLQEYVQHFNPNFIGLTGTEEEIVTVTAPFGIFFEKEEGTVETGYLLAHTATVAALDRDGKLRLLFPFETPGEEIAQDVKQLLRE